MRGPAAECRSAGDEDVGTRAETAPQAVSAGANVLVAGTAAFRGGPSAYAANIRALKGEG